MLALSVFVAIAAAPAPASLGFELMAPTGEGWSARAKDTRRLAERTLRVRTRLELRSIRQLGVPPTAAATCRKQPSLTCWVRALLALDSTPFSGVAPRGGTSFLLVRLLPLPRADRALVVMWLVDLLQAREIMRSAAPREAEYWLRRNATVGQRLEVGWNDGALETAFERLWDGQKQRLLGLGHWRPSGSLRVQTGWLPPYDVSIDGERAQTATSAAVVIDPVATGTHRVRIQSPDVELTRTVTIEMGRQSVLHVDGLGELRATADGRPALLWSGVGVAAVGAAVVVAGLAIPLQTEFVQICSSDGDCRESRRFARSSDYFTSRSSPDGGVGPLVVPMGYSLMITGGAWALTAALGDDPQVPWWAVVLGGALGGAAYGISEAFD